MAGGGACAVGVPAAIVCSTAMACAYVGSLYMVPLRLRRLHRDAPAHIRARFVAVSAASLGAVALFVAVTRGGTCFGVGVLGALGLRGTGAWAAPAAGLVLTASLYTGPLAVAAFGFAAYVRERGADGNGAFDGWGDWADAAVRVVEELAEERRAFYATPGAVEMTLRNLVVGPVSEELVFRACMIPLLLEAGVGVGRAVALSPLFFGVAHLHHLRRRVLDERAPWSEALAQTAFQLGYTTVFGVYTAFVFARTAHLSAAVVCHAFCNYMGLPDLDFAAAPDDLPWLSARERLTQVRLHEKRAALYGAHVAGVLLFGLLLAPLTAPTYFASPFWPAAEEVAGTAAPTPAVY